MTTQHAAEDEGSTYTSPSPSIASHRRSRGRDDLEVQDVASSDLKGLEAGHTSYHGIDTRNVLPGADEVYDAKISVLNEALIDLGMGSYQWMVFLTTGLGWFVDNVSGASSVIVILRLT